METVNWSLVWTNSRSTHKWPKNGIQKRPLGIERIDWLRTMDSNLVRSLAFVKRPSDSKQWATLLSDRCTLCSMIILRDTAIVIVIAIAISLCLLSSSTRTKSWFCVPFRKRTLTKALNYANPMSWTHPQHNNSDYDD